MWQPNCFSEQTTSRAAITGADLLYYCWWRWNLNWLRVISISRVSKNFALSELQRGRVVVRSPWSRLLSLICSIRQWWAWENFRYVTWAIEIRRASVTLARHSGSIWAPVDELIDQRATRASVRRPNILWKLLRRASECVSARVHCAKINWELQDYQQPYWGRNGNCSHMDWEF